MPCTKWEQSNSAAVHGAAPTCPGTESVLTGINKDVKFILHLEDLENVSEP